VDEQVVTRLETTIADTGALLVRLRKYRDGNGPETETLFRSAMRLGDEARRLHHREALDGAAAERLLADAQALVGELQRFLTRIHHGPAYRAAVAAHAAGDQAALAEALPAVFAGLEPVAAPPDLYAAVAWRRRGRPRPALEVAAEIARLEADGLVPEGDDLTPGTDPELPAVGLQDTPPADEAVVLRLAAGTIPLRVYRLAEIGDYLVYGRRVRVPLAVRLAAGPGEAQERLELDFAAYRAALASTLTAAGIAVELV
jgi:hypothetical protein